MMEKMKTRERMFFPPLCRARSHWGQLQNAAGIPSLAPVPKNMDIEGSPFTS